MIATQKRMIAKPCDLHPKLIISTQTTRLPPETFDFCPNQVHNKGTSQCSYMASSLFWHALCIFLLRSDSCHIVIYHAWASNNYIFIYNCTFNFCKNKKCTAKWNACMFQDWSQNYHNFFKTVSRVFPRNNKVWAHGPMSLKFDGPLL